MRRISEERTRKEMKAPPFVGGVDPHPEQEIGGGWYLHLFLQNRHLESADASTSSAQRLYEPPLDMFGTDAVERWFTEKEAEEVVEFANKLKV